MIDKVGAYSAQCEVRTHNFGIVTGHKYNTCDSTQAWYYQYTYVRLDVVLPELKRLNNNVAQSKGDDDVYNVRK